MGQFGTSMSVFVFGYGSLVNRATLGATPAHKARITGWRRAWRHTDLRPVAFLTAVPDPDAEIDGLIAGVPDGDWAALDVREAAYLRVPAATVRHAAPVANDIQIYHVPEGLHGPATTLHPVLLSYIDVVVQGYLAEFGEDGVAQFFDTTDGWDAPILDDRQAPRYPRHQVLSAEETALVDTHLDRVGAKRI